MMEKIIKIDGKNYTVSSDDNYLDAMGDEFEPHMVELFKSLIGPQDVVADIGANIGLTALLFSSLARKVIAFEPSSSTYKIFKDNITRADKSNVEAVNMGLGQQPETLTITFAKNNRSGGFVSDKIRLENGHVTEEICIDTMDRFFANTESPPSFLKIDVEGFEQNVIKGGADFLRKQKPTVVMEMNHFCLDVLQRITIPDFLDFMRSVFPKLYAIDTDNATIIDLHDPHMTYFVMHEHVVRHRFPNIVGAFDADIKLKLDRLLTRSAGTIALSKRLHDEANALKAKLVAGKVFDTPAVANPIGKISSKSMPRSTLAGEALTIPITLVNNSGVNWYGYGIHPVMLSYHWCAADGTMHVYDGLRTPLTCEMLSPGSTAEQMINVMAPKTSGNYRLILSLVQEGICWFENIGFHSTEAFVEVL